MSGELRHDRPSGGILRLTISNPEKRGALDRPILDAIVAAVGGASADGRTRCLVLTGEGRFFSSGYDIGDIPGESFAVEAERIVAHPFAEALRVLDETELPVVAALNGPAIGGGLELALACDLRIAAHGARFGMPPAKLGLVYSHTGIRRFVDTVGAPRTRELFLVGRRIDAVTALAWGLVNDVVEPQGLEAAALDWATEIAANAPLSVAGNKRIVREMLRAEGALSPEVERELMELRAASFASEDLREGVRAFSEKRPPRWRGR
ncbi:MAG: enoyl-CoA hydratase-related protein [Solirubrobacteraceae bacterium]|nr:enoyl-CoA hydratase-related protein [Solirubrobacteraceae bacterium]